MPACKAYMSVFKHKCRHLHTNTNMKYTNIGNNTSLGHGSKNRQQYTNVRQTNVPNLQWEVLVNFSIPNLGPVKYPVALGVLAAIEHDSTNDAIIGLVGIRNKGRN